MLLKIKVPLGIIVTGCLSLMGIMAIAIHFQIQATNDTLHGILDSFMARLETRQKAELRVLSSVAETIAYMPAIQQAFRAGNRDLLVANLKPTFENLRAKYGLNSLYFSTPPATIFLRMHNIQYFGDDVSEYRMMVVKAHHDEIPVSGVELSGGKLDIRSLFPVRDQTGYIGLVEMGSDFTTSVLEQVKNASGFDSGVFVANDFVNKIYSLEKQADSSEQQLMDNFRNMGSTRWELIQSVLKVARVAKFTNSPFRYEVEVGDEPYGVITVPLLDFSGNRIGFIVGTKSFTVLQQHLQNAIINIVAITLVMVIIFVAITLVFFHGFFLRPFNEICHNLQKVVQGDYQTTWQNLSNRPNEVGQLAKQLEHLQTVLATTKKVQEEDSDHA